MRGQGTDAGIMTGNNKARYKAITTAPKPRTSGPPMRTKRKVQKRLR